MDQAKAGAFIAQLRKEAGLTQEQLGQKLGVTNKTVSRWERGNYMPDLDSCLLLSEEFGVTINELLMGQRLSDGQIRQTANQVLTDAVRSGFTAAEQLRFYQRKWLGERRLLIAAVIAIWLGLLAAVYFGMAFLGEWRPVAGGLAVLLGVCAYGSLRNRMMGYAEGHVYGEDANAAQQCERQEEC